MCMAVRVSTCERHSEKRSLEFNEIYRMKIKNVNCILTGSIRILILYVVKFYLQMR